MQIHVEGFQWEWTFLYATEGIFVSGKTLVTPGRHGPARRRARADHADVSRRDPFLLRPRLCSSSATRSRAAPARSRSRRPSSGRSSPNAPSSAACGTRRMTFVVKVVSAARLSGVDQATAQGGAGHHLQRERHRPVARRAQHLVEHVLPGGPRGHAVHRARHERGRGDRAQLLDLRQLLPETDLLPVAQDHRPGERDARTSTALPPGRYYFQCDVHGPAMSGAFIVDNE